MNPTERRQLFQDFFEIQEQFGYGEISKAELEIKLKRLLDQYKPDDAAFNQLINEDCGISEIEHLIRDLR